MDDWHWTEAAFDEEFHEPLRARIKGELEPGEPLLWAGRPILKPPTLPRRTFVAATVGIFLLFFAAACLALAYRYRHRDVGGPVLIAAISLMLDFFIALALVSGASERKAARATLAETAYALTDRRLIIWQPVQLLYGNWLPGGPSTAVQVASHPRSAIREIHRVEYPDGSGDIQVRRRDSDDEGLWSTSLISGVADVRRVDRLIRDVLLGGIDRP